MIKVRIVAGPQTGRLFDLVEGQNFIGRQDGNQLVLPSTQISRRHACLTMADGRLFLEDLSSANGTYVNGARVQKVELRQGSRIQLGEFQLEAVFPGQPVHQPGMQPRVAPAPQQQQMPAHMMPNQQQLQQQQMQMQMHGMPPHMQQPQQMQGMQPQMPQQMPGMSQAGSSAPSMGSAPPDSLFWKLYRPMAAIPWRAQVLLLLLVMVGLNIGLVVKPILETQEEAVSQEALKRASTLVLSLAMKNGEFVKTQNETLYDTASFLRNEGVTDALLLNRDGSILSPPSQRGKQQRNGVMSQVTSAKSGEVVMLEENSVIPDGAAGTWHLATSMQVWNNDSARYETVGYAYLVFKADQVGQASTSRLVKTALYGGMITLMAVFVGLLITAMTARPIASVHEDGELALRGDGTVVRSRVKFPELEELAWTLNRAVERASRANAEIANVMANQGSGAGSSGVDEMADAKVEAIARAVPEAVLVVDEMLMVVFANANTERMVGRPFAQFRGRHLTEVLGHPQLLGAALDLFKDIMASRQPVLYRDVLLDAERRQAQVVVAGVLGSRQELKFAAVVIR